jgi:Holliday junction resolvase-like predicted endonuclease
MVLVDHGADILGRNIVVGRGEIDLYARFGSTVVAVEVKTLIVDRAMGTGPLRSFTPSKAEQVRWLARALRPRPQRVDVVAVVAHRDGVDVRWVRGA